MKIRAYIPQGGRLVQTDLDGAKAFLAETGLAPVAVQTEAGVSKVYARMFFGAYASMLLTQQARKLAEAAIWVSAVHAVARFGAEAGDAA